MTETRGNRSLWQMDFDARGFITFPWAEKCATGALMVNFDKYSSHIGDFDSADLFSLELRAIWNAAEAISSEGLPVDSASIAAHLESIGELTSLPNGVHFLLDLVYQIEDFADVSHFIEWLGIIRRAAAARRVVSQLRVIVDAAGSAPNLESLRSAISALGDELPVDNVSRESTMRESVEQFVDRLEAGISDTINVTIPDIDEMTEGFAPGELIVVGARPSHGKSMLALQMLDCAASRGVPSMFISEEMSRLSLAKRSLSSITAVDRRDWPNQIARLRFDIREHFNARAMINVRESCGTIDAVERVVAQNVRKHGIKICAIDYVQLLKAAGKNRYEMLTDISSRIKRIATRHNLIVFLLAQMNREMEKRSDPTPTLADLKDTGQLEQDADIVLAPFWPAKIDKQFGDQTEYRVYHLKNRNRGTDCRVVKMRVDPIRQRVFADDPWESAQG